MPNLRPYRVPPFQRDYSWDNDEWDDLWHDMIALFEPDGEPAHYMGYLVLQSSDNKRFDIIDGQQRITTTGKHIDRRDRNLEGGLSLAAIVMEENTIYMRTVFWNPTATKK